MQCHHAYTNIETSQLPLQCLTGSAEPSENVIIMTVLGPQITQPSSYEATNSQLFSCPFDTLSSTQVYIAYYGVVTLATTNHKTPTALVQHAHKLALPIYSLPSPITHSHHLAQKQLKDRPSAPYPPNPFLTDARPTYQSETPAQ